MASYLERERVTLAQQYPDFDRFDAGYEVPEVLYEALREAGERQGVAFDEAQFAASKPWMASQLKALTAQRLFGTEGFYRVMNAARVESFQRAVSLLEQA